MMSHNYIGTEHILLGLIHEGEGLAALVLDGCGVELDHVRVFVEREVGRGVKSPGGHIPFTPRAKKVLELSLREALQLRHNYIGTEHILLGLIREGEGLAAQALVDAGADLTDVRQRLLDRVGRGSKERPAEMFFPAGHALSERLAQIQESLDRIERHLGIQPPAEQPKDEQPKDQLRDQLRDPTRDEPKDEQGGEGREGLG